MNTHGIITELVTIRCEQAWHIDVEPVTSFNVRLPKFVGDESAEEKLEKLKAVCGAEFVLSCVVDRIPIASREEFRRKAGGDKTTREKLELAKAAMPGWDWKPSASQRANAILARNAELEGKLAAAELNKLREDRAKCRKLMESGVENALVLAEALFGEAIVEAVKIDQAAEAEATK